MPAILTTSSVSRSPPPRTRSEGVPQISKKYHPDRNPGDKQADASYKEVQEAYEMLNDPTKRRTTTSSASRKRRSGFPGAGSFPVGFPAAARAASPAASAARTSIPRWPRSCSSGSSAVARGGGRTWAISSAGRGAMVESRSRRPAGASRGRGDRALRGRGQRRLDRGAGRREPDRREGAAAWRTAKLREGRRAARRTSS